MGAPFLAPVCPAPAPATHTDARAPEGVGLGGQADRRDGERGRVEVHSRGSQRKGGREAEGSVIFPVQRSYTHATYTGPPSPANTPDTVSEEETAQSLCLARGYALSPDTHERGRMHTCGLSWLLWGLDAGDGRTSRLSVLVLPVHSPQQSQVFLRPSVTKRHHTGGGTDQKHHLLLVRAEQGLHGLSVLCRDREAVCWPLKDRTDGQVMRLTTLSAARHTCQVHLTHERSRREPADSRS